MYFKQSKAREWWNYGLVQFLRYETLAEVQLHCQGACTALLVWVAGWRLPLLVQVVYPPPLLPHRLHCTGDDNDDDSDADDDVDDQSDEAGAQTLLVHPPNLLSSLTTWASQYHVADDQDDENNVEVNASYSTGPISNPALLPQHYIVI